MDIEQITYETFDRVDRLDRDLRKHMKKEKTGSGAGTTINSSEITSSIKGSDDVNLSEVNTKIDGCGTTICGNIKGTDDVDLTLINEKLDKLTNYVDNNPTPIEFEEDPFKLDEEYTEYVPSDTVYNTSDSIETVKTYTLNERNTNGGSIIAFFAVYCEDPTFDIQITGDVELPTTADPYSRCISVRFLNTTYGDTNYSHKEISLQFGKNIFTGKVENINALENGTFIYINAANSFLKINSLKIEVIAKNVKILSKPSKFKVSSRYGKTVISKVENNDGYALVLNTDSLNPVDLKRTYTLKKEGVKDFWCLLTTYGNSGGVEREGFYGYTSVSLDHSCFQQIDQCPSQEQNIYSCTTCNVLENYRSPTSFYKTYSLVWYAKPRIAFHNNSSHSKQTFSDIKIFDNIGADTFIVTDHDVNINYSNATIIVTKTNGKNFLFIESNANYPLVDLGFGTNITAYYDKVNKDIIYIYCKVFDKMVKKTINIFETTDDEENTIKSATITQQKVIGSYDYYYETPTNVYFVAKNNELYMFKNE